MPRNATSHPHFHASAHTLPLSRSLLAIAIALAWLAPSPGTLLAQTSYPMLMSLEPAAACVGQTTEHTIHSRYSMYQASAVIVTGSGVTGEIIHPEQKEEDPAKPPSLTAMQVRFTVEESALPGVRDFRITTPNGVSTLGQLVIAREKTITETSPNDRADQAQEVAIPATLCGAIEKAEDVDYFKFHASAGDAFSFHVRSMRLQNRIHDLQQHSDPILTLRNAAGSTVATSDNFFFGDPFFAHQFTQEGDYYLEIRDVRYQGNKYWQYSIEVSNAPFATQAYPLAVAPGKATRLQVVGYHLGQATSADVQLEQDASCGEVQLALPLADDVHTNPVPLVVSDLPLVNEPTTENNTVETASMVTLPGGINGRIEQESDVDCFAFEAKKDEKYSFEIIARRLGSALDSHLRLLNSDGKQLQLNDDLRIGKRGSSDSWIENWQVPADGKYILEVRDLHLRGGDPFVYHLRVTKAEPYFELYLDTDKTQLTPGTSGIMFVRAVKKNGFDGEIALQIDGLPAGVTGHCGRILAGKAVDGCIVLTAADDATPTWGNVTIRGVSEIPSETGDAVSLSAQAVPYQETYQPGGGRGHYPVALHTVAIAAPSDIRAVKLSTHELTLKPGGSAKVDITIERAEGFDKNVSLDVIFKHLSSVYGNSLPAGVTLDGGASKVLLTKGAVTGHITLQAAADAAPVQKQQIAVMANVSLNFVMKATYSSKPLLVTVTE